MKRQIKAIAVACLGLALAACELDQGESAGEYVAAVESAGQPDSALMEPDEVAALESALTDAIDATDETIADLEGEIASLEADQQTKVGEINALIGQIQARKAEIEENYEDNQDICILCMLFGCPNVCYLSLANMLADDSWLQQLDSDLAVAEQQRAAIEQQLADYRSRRDQLRDDLEALQSARELLVSQLNNGNPAVRPALAAYPELAERVARVELLQAILGNATSQVTILEQIRQLAQQVDESLDEALALLRGLAAEADAAAAESREATLALVEVLTAPDPNAAAAAWLENAVAQQTKELIAAMGWPMADFVTQLLADRGPTDPAERATLATQLSTALGVPAPQPGPLVRSYIVAADDYPILDNHTSISAKTVTTNGTLKKVRIFVEIYHTYISDLDVYLVHDGVTAHLHARTGGGADDINAWYDVPALAGHPLEGEWQLQVADRANGDTGTIGGWSAEVTYRAKD
jgi:proprotein convertase P-domain-containing protein/transcription factor-like protein